MGFFIRLALPILIVLVLALIFTAPLWSKWLAKLVIKVRGTLDEAGQNLKDIEKKEK